MNKQHIVRLTPAERADIGVHLRREGSSTLTQRRARILLHADAGGGGPRLTDIDVAAAVGVTSRTVARVRSQLVTDGLTAALGRRTRSDRRPRKLAGETEARLVALACAEPPAGHARWTLRLLTARLVALEFVDRVSPETVRQALKKTSSSHG